MSPTQAIHLDEGIFDQTALKFEQFNFKLTFSVFVFIPTVFYFEERS